MKRIFLIGILLFHVVAFGQSRKAAHFALYEQTEEVQDTGLFPAYQNVVDWANANSITPPTDAENEINSNLYQNIDAFFKPDWLHIYTTNSNKEFSKINWANPGTFNATEVASPDFELKKGFKAAAGDPNYLRTGYIPSTHAVHFKADSGTFGLVIYAPGAVGSNWMMGSRYGGGGDLLIRNNHFRINNAISPNPGMSTIAGSDTLCITINRAGENVYVYINGVQHYYDNNSPLGSLPAIESYLIRANENGNLGGSFPEMIMAAFTGSYIEPANQAAFSNEMKRAIWRKGQLTASDGGGSPPPAANASSPLVSRTASSSDVNTWISLMPETETNRFGESQSLIKMLDTSDIKIAGKRFSDQLDTLIPDNAWEIPNEYVKSSWKITDNLIEWKRPFSCDTFGIWTGNNFIDQKYGIVLMAGNSIGSMVPISDTLNWSFSRKFQYFQSLDTTSYRYFKVERYKVDVNGYETSSNSGIPVKLILAGKFNGAEAPKPLPLDTLPKFVKTTFGQHTGINTFPNDSIEALDNFAGKTLFVNLTWHYTAPGEPFAIYYPWLGSYTLANPFPGISDSYLTEHMRGGYTQLLRAWDRRNKNNFVFMRFQENSNANLRDSASQYYNEKTGALVSADAFITDTTWFFPDKYRSYPVDGSVNAVDTIINASRNLASYDYRKYIQQKWLKERYYPTVDSNLSDWITSKTYFASKSGAYLGLDTSRVASIVKAIRLTGDRIGLIADPSKRDSVLLSPQTYAEFGELMFSYSGIMGRNPIPTTDLRVRDYTKVTTGNDVVDATSMVNEGFKTWQDGLAHHDPRFLGMALSVWYDGHGGTVSDTRGGKRVGLHTADSTMIFGMPSDLDDDMNWSISTRLWCEYYRARDFHLMPDFHPYSGEAKHIILKNVAWDPHIYQFSSGIGSNQTVIENDYAVTWEEYPSRLKLPKGLSVIRALWPDDEVYCSEYGFGHNGTHRLGAAKSRIGLGYDSIAGDWIRDTTYDLLDAQASNNDWQTFHNHRYMERSFLYHITDEPLYSAPLLGDSRPYLLDRDSIWKNEDFITGFPSNGLLTNIQATATADKSNTKKPAYYSFITINSLLEDAYQISYTQDSINKVSWFTYYDSIADVYYIPIRRYTSVNGTTEDYSINIPSGYNNVTRIEPIRETDPLPVSDLGSISTYVTDIRRKIFHLKM